MSELLLIFRDDQFVQSCVLIAALLSLRILLIYLIKRNREVLTEGRRHSITRVKNFSWLIIVFGLLMIWWPELKNFAFSIAAVTVALVIATKELIVCFSGAMLRAGTGAFTTRSELYISGDHWRGRMRHYCSPRRRLVMERRAPACPGSRSGRRTALGLSLGGSAFQGCPLGSPKPIAGTSPSAVPRTRV